MDKGEEGCPAPHGAPQSRDEWRSKLCLQLNELYSAGVLQSVEYESIDSEATSLRRAERLLSIMYRKSQQHTDQFFHALDRTGQRHVTDHVTARQHGN